MKKTIIISILPLMAFLFFIAAQMPTAPENPGSDWPEDIVKILDRSCYDCHSSESSNARAKSAINFSKWADYNSRKQAKRFTKIAEEVKQQNMPPSKYLKNYPDNALSDDEINTIVNWANEQAKLLQE